MTLLLVFLAIAVAGLTVLLSLGRFSESLSPDDDDPGHALAEPVASLPPVLLPVPAEAEDLNRLRFSTALRGYRMDQVDEVLLLLASELERRDLLIAELRRGGSSYRAGTDGPSNVD